MKRKQTTEIFILIQFRNEKDAERAVTDLNTRWFDRKPIYAELSPVTDFKEASCRQYELGEVRYSFVFSLDG